MNKEKLKQRLEKKEKQLIDLIVKREITKNELKKISRKIHCMQNSIRVTKTKV